MALEPCFWKYVKIPPFDLNMRHLNHFESYGIICRVKLNIVGPSGRAVYRRRSAAARLLGLWVRIPPGAWMSVCCDCCVLSGRGLYDELITRPEESYRMWCVVVCDRETSRMWRPWPALGRRTTGGYYIYIYRVRQKKCIHTLTEKNSTLYNRLL